MKKVVADRSVFKHQPRSFVVETSHVAKDFVNLQTEKSSDFQIADVVAAQSGVQALRKQNIEAQVEGTVLERLKEIEEEAYKQAYALGLIEGVEKAFGEHTAMLAERLTRLDAICDRLEKVKTTVLKESETVLMKLVFEIAKRIAMREVSISQEPVTQLLSGLVDELQGADNIQVRLHPDDLAFIEELRSKGVKDAEKLERVKLLATASVQKGGCLIETNFGEIDATVEQRVEKAWATIQAKLPTIKKDVPA